MTHDIEAEDEEERVRKEAFNSSVLKSVKNVLENKELILEVLAKYDLENENLEEYEIN